MRAYLKQDFDALDWCGDECRGHSREETGESEFGVGQCRTGSVWSHGVDNFLSHSVAL